MPEYNKDDTILDDIEINRVTKKLLVTRPIQPRHLYASCSQRKLKSRHVYRIIGDVTKTDLHIGDARLVHPRLQWTWPISYLYLWIGKRTTTWAWAAAAFRPALNCRTVNPSCARINSLSQPPPPRRHLLLAATSAASSPPTPPCAPPAAATRRAWPAARQRPGGSTRAARGAAQRRRGGLDM